MIVCACFSNIQEIKEGPDFVVVTPPKCGTHLLTKMLTLLTEKEPLNFFGTPDNLRHLKRLLYQAGTRGNYLHLHATPEQFIIGELKKRNMKVVFILRDPRDQLVSMYHWILSGHHPYTPLDQLPAQEDQIMELITGEHFDFAAVDSSIVCRKDWMNQPSGFVYTARFEKLIGEKGGGSQVEQLEEIDNIIHHLGVDISEEKRLEIAMNMFGDTWTFRKGQIGDWKNHFTEKHVSEFKKRYGNLLIELGYEFDLEW